MRREAVLTVLLLALAGPAVRAASSGSAGSSPAGSYFPSAPGTTWRYSNGETQRLEAPRTVRGQQVTPLRHTVAGLLVSEDLLEYRPEGVFLRGVQPYTGAGRSGSEKPGRLTWYTPPLQVYPAAPLSAGQFWSSASGSLRLSGRVLGTQPVSTPAGSFNTYVVRSEINAAGGLSVQYSFVVPGLGVVRFQTADGSTTDLLK